MDGAGDRQAFVTMASDAVGSVTITVDVQDAPASRLSPARCGVRCARIAGVWRLARSLPIVSLVRIEAWRRLAPRPAWRPCQECADGDTGDSGPPETSACAL
jgi:hypothetical protein